MIVGIGIDVCAVARLERSLSRTPRLASRLFTDVEQVTADGRPRPVEGLAARFAAKEAVAKCLGAPPGLRWRDAEVVSADDGRPQLRVSGTVAAAAERAGVARWHVSLSHDGGIATAVVLAEA